MSLSSREVNRRLTDPGFAGSFESSETTDGALVVARVIVSRERSRVRILAAATAASWLAATVAGIWLAYLVVHESREHFVISMHRYAVAQQQLAPEAADEKKSGVFVHVDPERLEEFRAAQAEFDDFSTTVMVLTQSTIGLAGLAALLSVWLILASRRATLKQINVGLAAVAEQLKAIAQPTPSAQPTPVTDDPLSAAAGNASC